MSEEDDDGLFGFGVFTGHFLQRSESYILEVEVYDTEPPFLDTINANVKGKQFHAFNISEVGSYHAKIGQPFMDAPRVIVLLLHLEFEALVDYADITFLNGPRPEPSLEIINTDFELVHLHDKERVANFVRSMSKYELSVGPVSWKPTGTVEIETAGRLDKGKFRPPAKTKVGIALGPPEESEIPIKENNYVFDGVTVRPTAGESHWILTLRRRYAPRTFVKQT